MAERSIGREYFTWQIALCTVLGATIVLLLLFTWDHDALWLYLLIVLPFFCLSAILLLIVAAIRTKWRRCLSILLTALAVLAVSGALIRKEDVLRPFLRWLFWSRTYKAELLKAPESPNGELRHIEWDSWGWGPIGPTRVYLVFDQSDSLSAAAKSNQPGRFRSIPCKVSSVQRLERNWYAVTFYTEESWGKVNRLNCSGT
jgi:hypothetical protein